MMEPIVSEEWFSLDGLVESYRDTCIQQRLALAQAVIWPSIGCGGIFIGWTVSKCLDYSPTEQGVFLLLSCAAFSVLIGLGASLYMAGLAPWRHRLVGYAAMFLLTLQTWMIIGIAWEPATLRHRVERLRDRSSMLVDTWNLETVSRQVAPYFNLDSSFREKRRSPVDAWHRCGQN